MSSVACGGVQLGHEFPVGGAGGGEILIAFFELQAQVGCLLLELGGRWSQPVEAIELRLSPGLSARRSSANTSAGVLN